MGGWDRGRVVLGSVHGYAHGEKAAFASWEFSLIYLCRVRSELLRAAHCQDHPGEGCTRQDLLDSSGHANEQGKAASVVPVGIGVDCSRVRQFSLCSQKCSGSSGSRLPWAAGKGLI